MTFRPKVLKATVEKELRWLGHLGFPGLFDGEHYFLLTALGNEHTRFTQGEQFSGVLVSLFIFGMKTSTESGFKAMNEALKHRAEAIDHAGGDFSRVDVLRESTQE